MEFKLVIKTLLAEFEKAKVRYALMGGFALGALGIPRATVDIDFLVLRDDMERVSGIMAGMGYRCVYKSENVSQYVSSEKIFGEVDFLHAFRESSMGMLERAEDIKIFGEELAIKVVKPEDLIGLKVQAMANDETRKAVDLADIEALMAHYGTKLDWLVIEEYFSIFGMSETAKELRRKYSGS
ncbi:MAG: hypothetical protein HW415_2018 [Deltaproteobacteria bacterium]|nr:hypothetical protein [Deltaproteobacteria bacterium]